MNACIDFEISIKKNDNTVSRKCWKLDLSRDSSTPSLIMIVEGPGGGKSSSIATASTISCQDSVFVALTMGKIKPEIAYMSGQLKVKGSIGAAMKMRNVLDASRDIMDKL